MRGAHVARRERRRARLAIAGTVALLPLGAFVWVLASGSASGTASSIPPDPVYGLTIDQVTAIATVVSGIEALPYKPTVRVVFTWDKEEPTPPSDYATAIKDLDPHAWVMVDLLDGNWNKGVTVATYTADVKSALATLGTTVNVWEVGNEINGNWTGSYATDAARFIAGYDDVAAAGYPTALDLFANEYGPTHCGDGDTEPTPVQYSEQYIPASVRDGLDYVMESYYPPTCATVLPTTAAVATEMEQLHSLYPNAKVGFGELGTPNAITTKTEAEGAKIMAWGYSLNPGLNYYMGGYFWWNAYEDCFTGKKLLASNLASAFEAENAALGSESHVAPTFTSASAARFTVGKGGSFTVTTSGTPAAGLTESGTLPSGISFKTAGGGTATLSGTTPTGTTGTYPITFSATNGVAPAASQSFTLTVDESPAITSSGATTFTVGSPGSFSVTATGYPSPTFSETGAALPSGVTLAPTGKLQGTPGAGTGGSYTISITATNGVSPATTQSFTLTVDQAPAITSAPSATFAVGEATTFQVTATGYPAPTVTESGSLPSGVTLSTTGVLSGIPATGTAGTYSITIAATNGIGAVATQAFTLSVEKTRPPGITSAASATFTYGTAETFIVTTTGAPLPSLSNASFTGCSKTTPLPAGLGFSPNGNGTATVDDTSSTPVGTDTLCINASNTLGTATQILTVTVVPALETTSTALNVSSPVTYGTETTASFTAMVTGQPGDGYPEGTLSVTSGSSTWCSVSLGASSGDTTTFGCNLTASQLAPGSYTLQATYAPAATSSSNPDYVYSTSTSGTESLVVQAAATFTITVTAGASAKIAQGTSATLAESGLPTSGTGTISFKESGGTTLCTTTPATGHCSTPATLAFGTYGGIGATYSGTATYGATGSSNTVTLSVYAKNGSGTMQTAASVVETTPVTLVFTFTSGTGGMTGGTVTLAVPSRWTKPQTTNASVAGYVSVSGGLVVAITGSRTIKVTGVTLAGGASFTITLHKTDSSRTGTYTFTTKEASIAGGTLTTIASSPKVTVNS